MKNKIIVGIGILVLILILTLSTPAAWNSANTATFQIGDSINMHKKGGVIYISSEASELIIAEGIIIEINTLD